MLDISHPLADGVLFVARVEDKIRVYLIAWKDTCETQSQAICHF
jgi:hypothetical protein